MKNIRELLKMQKDLDTLILNKIEKEQREVVPHIILALYTEIGEFCNEVESFKYWKQNKKNNKERMLDEYADCIHFVFSLLNAQEDEVNEFNKSVMEDEMIEDKESELAKPFVREDLTFESMRVVSKEETEKELSKYNKEDLDKGRTKLFLEIYDAIVDMEMLAVLHLLTNIMFTLGIDEEELENAYIAKNKVNYERQANNY